MKILSSDTLVKVTRVLPKKIRKSVLWNRYHTELAAVYLKRIQDPKTKEDMRHRKEAYDQYKASIKHTKEAKKKRTEIPLAALKAYAAEQAQDYLMYNNFNLDKLKKALSIQRASPPNAGDRKAPSALINPKPKVQQKTKEEVKPLSKEEQKKAILKKNGHTIERYTKDRDIHFQDQYIEYPKRRTALVEKWKQNLQTMKDDPFRVLYYQELLEKAALHRAHERAEKERLKHKNKKREKGLDLER